MLDDPMFVCAVALQFYRDVSVFTKTHHAPRIYKCRCIPVAAVSEEFGDHLTIRVRATEVDGDEYLCTLHQKQQLLRVICYRYHGR